MNPDPGAPVVVGAAAVQQRETAPPWGVDALSLMRAAVESAADDAESRSLLAAADVVMIPQGTWPATGNPASVVLPWNPSVRSIVAEIGVLQQTLLSRACAMVAGGDADVVVVVGGEAKYRALQAQIAGVAPDDAQPDGAATERMVPSQEIITREEIERGLPVPARQYAMIDTALRAHDGLSPAEHVDVLAELQARSSAVAAANPLAWNRVAVTAAAIRDAPMMAWPYTKLHCSQWNVDQAAAIIVCSTAAAARHGVGDDRFVFPAVGVESNLMVPMTLRADVHRSPAIDALGDAVRHHTGLDPAGIDLVELYSCFPAAVRVQQREFGIDPMRPTTITGGMTFAGGPLNNATLQATVAMVHALRERGSGHGMVTNVSGMLTKVGLTVWSAQPPAVPFRAIDVTAAATANTAVSPFDATYAGPATVVTYTVAFDRAEPTQGIVLAESSNGVRALASTTDPSLIDDMLKHDWCRRRVETNASTLLG